MERKPILLDLGGVMLDLDPLKSVRNFKERCGFEDIEEYLNIYHQRGFISDFEEGILSTEEFYAEALRHCRPGTTPEDIRESFCSLITGPIESTLAQVRELSKTRELYALSNNNPVCAAKFREILGAEGVWDCFREFFFSYEMHLLKPGREIFEEAARRIGCAPSEITFYDDAGMNVDGARAAGLNAVLFVKDRTVIG